ncbi:phosphatase PAP2 family protein [Brevibacterium casei]|uniref:Phosphatase PAP2 family protein n=2 Tax=Brevibacterium casei TaxID=33889 RepID=A0A161S9U9_9MICO|nr:phosphatase PAP2 family protein [Brevibacterium casei]KZE22906.1 hypothetical protein AVW13_05900 [Brevibacterium casei]MBE4694956.1 phosphatase PAP2 family protein [Brevibacterium casei]MBY3578078.1 phosphatase PAP2 family protein [Brevibacterium casei]MCT1550069.1 phosphatase PAP2 family protein [Brevibacterium casei]MCT1767033.1 phosphatase PAP2 family protein [Brevibacterium casei]
MPYWICVTLAEVGGATGAVVCTGVAAGILVLLRRLRAAAVIVTTMLLGVGLSEAIKAVVERLRPGDQLYNSLGFSYPSGHSMGAAALALSLALIIAHARSSRGPDSTRLRFHWSMVLVPVWILAMMWSRTALQVHWLTDTIAGALLGLSAALLADAFWIWVALRTRSPLLAR